MKLPSVKSLLIAIFTLFSITAVQAEERVVATVDGYPIMQSQLKKALGKRANTEANRKAALESLVDEFLVQRAIQESGVQVNPQYVDQMIEVMAAQNGLTYGQFLDALDYQGISLEQYSQQIAHQILMEQVRHQAIGQSIEVKPEELEVLAKELLESDKKKGKLKTSKATQYRISHILIKLNPIMDDAKAKAKLTELFKEIQAGKITFEAAAALNSLDYVSGADGGNLGWNFLEVYDPAFSKVAKATKKGQVSQPFKTQFGWHILKITDTRESDRTQDVYLQKAYQQSVNKQAQEAAKDWVKALKKNAEIKYFD